MLSLKEFMLTEKFKNFLQSDTESKEKYAEEVYDMIQKAYESQGGIHGSGFHSPEDMVKNIPFWKLGFKNGKLVAVTMYKDKEGRKTVASATNGSPDGKSVLTNIMIADLAQQRAFKEVSGKALSFLKKNTNVLDFVMPVDKIQKTLDKEIRIPEADDPELVRHPELKDYFYQRKIGGGWHTKIALGTVGNKIIE